VTFDARVLLTRLAEGVRAALADQVLDVQLLQTAASVENAIAGAYDTLLGLPSLSASNANPLLKNLIQTARGQHVDHAKAVNDLAGALGGKAQTGSNATLAQTVTRARSGLTDLGPLIDLAAQLETVSMQTYQNAVGLFNDLNARRLTSSIMGVEAQHVGVLLVAKALVAGRLPDLVALDSSTGAKWPPGAVVAGFPDTFSKLDQARPVGDGAVK
jgi:hypothetical protein